MGLRIIFSAEALNDLSFWKQTGNKKIQKKISSLLIAIQSEPFSGIGKPEPLKFELSGKWSRRINQEHRIIYEILSETIIIHSLKGHYNI